MLKSARWLLVWSFALSGIGLVLGVTAVLRELPFSKSVRRIELPWLIGATLLALVCLLNLYLGTLDGLVLLAGLGVIMYRLMQQATQADDIKETIAEELDDLPSMSTVRALVWLAVGLFVLLLSANMLVWAATTIAHILGVSDLIIGLTVIAVGTSLPELAATVGAALRGHPDIAIGNVVGSNILNILAVLAVPALVHPTSFEGAVLWRDFGMMLALTVLLVLFANGSRPVITRFEGAVMVVAWLGYNTLLYAQA